jgi:hypothetical protein
MEFGLLKFFDEPAVLEFELSELDGVHGLVAFGNARE